MPVVHPYPVVPVVHLAEREECHRGRAEPVAQVVHHPVRAEPVVHLAEREVHHRGRAEPVAQVVHHPVRAEPVASAAFQVASVVYRQSFRQSLFNPPDCYCWRRLDIGGCGITIVAQGAAVLWTVEHPLSNRCGCKGLMNQS